MVSVAPEETAVFSDTTMGDWAFVHVVFEVIERACAGKTKRK
jgi:hypothetical protein